jgi:hypothetical protein
MGHTTVGVRVIVLGYEDSFVRVALTECYHSTMKWLEDARQAPAIYHLWVGFHVYSVVDGVGILVDDGKQKVLCHPVFLDSGSIWIESPLADEA